MNQLYGKTRPRCPIPRPLNRMIRLIRGQHAASWFPARPRRGSGKPGVGESRNRPPGREYFTRPVQPNQRRYEALRAYFTEDLTVAEAGARAGYTRASMASLLRDFPGRPAAAVRPARQARPPEPPRPGSAPRARVIELRRQGLSGSEISARLRAGGTPLNRTGVGQILARGLGAGCCAAPRPPPAPARRRQGRDTRLPRTAVIDFAAFPARAETSLAGLLLAVPDLVSLDLPALIRAAGYPGTSVIPAVSWLLSLLALKLTGTRRVSHVDDLLTDPASALFAGLAVLPKKSALTSYSWRLSHDNQQKLLAALDKKMMSAGLATANEAVFDLDFHAVMHWGQEPLPGKALRAHPVPARPLRPDLLRPGHRHPQPGLRKRRHLQGHPGTRGHRVLRPLESRLRI